MTAKRLKSKAGFTFVEILLATVVLLIAILGASAFRYNAALSARQADAQMTAARTALLLCESWRGVGGSTTYDPVASLGSELVIEHADQGPTKPDDFGSLGRYRITTDGVEYYAALAWRNVSPGLRALHIAVAWGQPGLHNQYHHRRLFKLTNYVSVSEGLDDG